MFELIDANVAKHIQLTKEEVNLFHSLLYIKKFKKKQFLLEPGEICNFTGFINKGCIKNYIVDEKGNDFIMSFGIEDWWVGDISSFFEHKPASLYIETLEDTELLMMDTKEIEQLFTGIPKFERFFRILIQRSLTTLQARFYQTLAKPAEERYVEFLRKYPQVAQRVPQQLIASYIGVTPEFLSKIRNKMVRKV